MLEVVMASIVQAKLVLVCFCLHVSRFKQSTILVSGTGSPTTKTDK